MKNGASPSGKLLFEKNGVITRITLNRPACHNALDRELSTDLQEAFRAVELDTECKILILTGAGNTFCTGDDIKEFNDWTQADPEIQVKYYQNTVRILENLRPVTIALVDGVCTGGGLELTLASDFVIATNRSRWGMPEINWDITPGWGGTAKIAKFAGRRKALEWNLLGTLFSAQKAERYDMVNRLVEPEDLEAEGQKIVDIILSKNERVVNLTKYCVKKGADLDFTNVMAFEGIPQRLTIKEATGIAEFVETDTRNKRRELLDGFWFD